MALLLLRSPLMNVGLLKASGILRHPAQVCAGAAEGGQRLPGRGPDAAVYFLTWNCLLLFAMADLSVTDMSTMLSCRP